MIRVDRSSVVVPLSLTKTGASEEKAIVLAYDGYFNANPRPKNFTFTFRAYKKADVKRALGQLFRGKCAYCESRYAGTQPMDVEHWRPKGGVQEPGQQGLAEGYPWLAARWTNLLPSCIDCNRPRVQHDELTNLDETLGKANQFPVVGPRMQRPLPGSTTQPVEDNPLLIDPTVDDPSLHIRFRDDGVAMALTDKGTQSIRIYALNRAELVFERLGVARLVEQRLELIERLAIVIADPQLNQQLKLDLQDLVAHEINALLELTEPHQRTPPWRASSSRRARRCGPPPRPSPSCGPPTWATCSDGSAA